MTYSALRWRMKSLVQLGQEGKFDIWMTLIKVK